MSEDEDRGIPEKNGNRTVQLKLGNFVGWLQYIKNRIKGLKSPELELMLITGIKPTWIAPGFGDKIRDDNGDYVRVFSDDKTGEGN